MIGPGFAAGVDEAFIIAAILAVLLGIAAGVLVGIVIGYWWFA